MLPVADLYLRYRLVLCLTTCSTGHLPASRSALHLLTLPFNHANEGELPLQTSEPTDLGLMLTIPLCPMLVATLEHTTTPLLSNDETFKDLKPEFISSGVRHSS